MFSAASCIAGFLCHKIQASHTIPGRIHESNSQWDLSYCPYLPGSHFNIFPPPKTLLHCNTTGQWRMPPGRQEMRGLATPGSVFPKLNGGSFGRRKQGRVIQDARSLFLLHRLFCLLRIELHLSVLSSTVLQVRGEEWGYFSGR